MMEIDAMTDAQKAWLLLKQMENMKYMLWELYHDEFTVWQKHENELQNMEDDMPF